ncbi:MAG TPA: VOC family protein [Gemmatimonadaceae bacterium]|nr:VOC family protein [Gemmatimonadaceae bacterium]
MIPTFGLTHLALGVADVERAFEFYEQVFGMVAVYRSEDFLQAQTPGARDVVVFERTRRKPGQSGSIAHFGFRLTDPESISAAAEAIEHAGGTIVEQGEFCPGEPYVFARDRDGYLIEVWFEIQTPVDPK